MKKLIFASALTSLIFWVAIPLRAVELSESSCYECHDELAKEFSEGKVHEPIVDGDCESCHEDHGEEYELVLTDEVPALCFGCHDEYSANHLHEPVADGDCQSCHDVHRSDNAYLLTASIPDLCSECHDSYGEAKSVHEPVASGDCLDCHRSHQSDASALLNTAVPELCSDCHDDVEKSKGQYPHEPVAGGDCLDCHQAHQADHSILLAENYVTERYAFYSTDGYTLCYSCHETEAFESENGEGLTEFRNGNNNLHYLHVVGNEEVNKYGIKKKKEGMTCVGCHLSHGTDQPKMIRPTLDCGATACYTINFRKFEGGGTCVVGCHKPKVYKVSPISQGGENISPLAKGNQ